VEQIEGEPRQAARPAAPRTGGRDRLRVGAPEAGDQRLLRAGEQRRRGGCGRFGFCSRLGGAGGFPRGGKAPAPRPEPAPLGPLFVKLSPREIEILDLVARGNSNKIIGRKLSISDQTVKNHVSAILRKLEVNDRTEAVVYALRNGWIRMEAAAS